MADFPRSDPRHSYNDDLHNTPPPRDSADTDIDLEEAQLLLREEFDFEDTDYAAQKSASQHTHYLNFLTGPHPPQQQKIQPWFPTIQNSPANLLSRLLPHPSQRNLFLNAILTTWLLAFTSLLATELPTPDGHGSYVVNLSCTDTLWARKNECGLNGINCRPFTNSSFAFRCPLKCGDARVLNPHAVGSLDVVYRPLVVGRGTYRGDSFLCGAAVHDGVVAGKGGGCGRVNLIGEYGGFESAWGNGIESVAFDSEFPLAFRFEEVGVKCGGEPRSVLLVVSMLATAVLCLFSDKSKVFFPVFVLVFAQVAFVSDPPEASYRNLSVLPDRLSMFARRLLPAFFVAVIIWKTVVKRTLSGLNAPIEKTVLWLGGFWIGALSNYTFDWIPISRLTAHDLEQQPGAKLALAIIIAVLAVIALGQMYYFWLEGRLLKYLGLYGLFVFGIVFCLAIPGVNLRIHHYIIGLLLLPGTSIQTRPSLIYQGILLGLFVNGIARWDFDSILQTTAALREDGSFNSVIPAVLKPVVEVSAERGLVASFTWVFLPDGVDGISVLVNDVERYRAFRDEKPTGDTFQWGRSPDDAMSDYFRFAFIQNGRTLDYSEAGTLYGNGTWVA